jgi:chemotaxis protein MotB
MRVSRIAQRFLLPLAFLAVLGLLSGCVTRGTYDEVVKERDALAMERDEAEAEASQMTSVAVDLGNEVMMRDLEIAVLEREQEELADEVARWAVRGAIKMHLLADGLHLVLPQDILFESGEATLSPEGEELIAELAQEINEQPYQIGVLGFTDNVPVGPKLMERFPSNWELAGARAASVVRVIEAAGVPAGQLIAVSRGEGEPIASNDTPEGRAQNRRIDVRIRPVVKK